MAWTDKLAEFLRLNDGQQAYTGYPQMQVGLNKPRQAGYATGFLEGATGAESMQPKNPITDPNYDQYAQGKNIGELAGIGAMALTPLALSRKQLLSKQMQDLQDTALIKGSPMDVSSTFGKGAERIQYKDPNSEGFINLLVKPDGTASVLGLEVSEKFRGKGIGQKLQEQAMKDYPELQGQVSSKAAAKTAYRLGRRPVGQPNATLDDVFKAIDEDSSINLITPKMQESFNK
jgi:ribosomal protein S18 acetylase RimI-like enzyme